MHEVNARVTPIQLVYGHTSPPILPRGLGKRGYPQWTTHQETSPRPSDLQTRLPLFLAEGPAVSGWSCSHWMKHQGSMGLKGGRFRLITLSTPPRV